MNANVLAEDLEGAKLVILKLNEMLRQQQTEIDNLAIVKYLNGVTISKLYAEIEALNIELAHYKPNGEMGTVFIFEDEQEK